MKSKILGIIVAVLVTVSYFPGTSLGQDSGEELHALSGSVYNAEGQPAGATSVKVASMDSVWSTEGTYSIGGIPSGEHTARAYFMDDGHTVVYRKIMISSDSVIDWHKGKNWVTFEFGEDSTLTPTSVELTQTSEETESYSGLGEFGPHDIGSYYSLVANYDDGTESSQHIHFRMEAGSSSDPSPNHFDFNHGHNSVYGFMQDSNGTPVPDVKVTTGELSFSTNSDGFFLFQNLEVGTSHTFSASYWGNELMEPVTTEIFSGENWMNLTASVEKNMPDYANFTTQIITTSVESVNVHWVGGEYTDYYSLFLDDELVYRGEQEYYRFDPQQPGNYYFSLETTNSNGSRMNPKELRVVVLPMQSSSDLWSSGMSWDYSILHTPYFQQNKTYTAIGSEMVQDSFGNLVESYIVRVSDDEYEEGEKAFRWVDSESLMTVHTYWADSPSVSSYYQEGFLGWRFSDTSGNTVNPLHYRGVEDVSLHFNRTNIIGVPGHPNGYDDTTNKVEITHGVSLETPAGSFMTTYLRITDDGDGVVSWEMWYNETVRNWVKVIDRIPGSHSDVVSWELTSFEVPVTPQFITENDSKLTDDEFNIEWASFQGALAYELTENGDLIYNGQATNFSVTDRADGAYIYEIRALMETGRTIDGESIHLTVSFVLNPPTFSTNSHSIDGTSAELSWSEVEGEAQYTVLVIYGDGTSSVAYEGTENSARVDVLEPGINRIRVKAALSDGVASEYSDSIFITVSEDDDSDRLPFHSSVATILLLLTVPMLSRRREPQ